MAKANCNCNLLLVFPKLKKRIILQRTAMETSGTVRSRSRLTVVVFLHPLRFCSFFSAVVPWMFVHDASVEPRSHESARRDSPVLKMCGESDVKK